jgi:hypothetical protein
MKGVMTDDQFMKLFKYVEKRFDELQEELSSKADGERVYKAFDAIAKNQGIEQQERAAMLRQLDRHERWHHRTADKIGLKLDYQEQ